MPMFRIFGDKLNKYYVDVEADNLEQAYEFADSLHPDSWAQYEETGKIESYSHEELNS